jgi:hypothetical protein
MKKILDEHGVVWEVKPKDPAMALVRSLNKNNYTYIILPRHTLRTGEFDTAVDDVVEWGSLCELDEIRLRDCLHKLRSSV